LIGGGSAKGLPNDTAVVYTPVGDELKKVVLPFGSFVNDKFKATGNQARRNSVPSLQAFYVVQQSLALSVTPRERAERMEVWSKFNLLFHVNI
jgi:hypothetical protein